jgi:hypothetical protein
MATTSTSQNPQGSRRSTTFRGVVKNVRASISAKGDSASRQSISTNIDFDASFSNSFNNSIESDASLTRRLLARFPSLSRFERQSLVINLIKQCDPGDMLYLTTKIPNLHRDFIRLLPSKTVHSILSYIHPKDFCAVVGVSKAWKKTASNVTLWQKLYANLGLVAMANAYYFPNAPMLVNAKRLYSLGNWSKGIFVFKKFRAHPLGILCIAFDGKQIAVCISFTYCKLFSLFFGMYDRRAALTGHVAFSMSKPGTVSGLLPAMNKRYSVLQWTRPVYVNLLFHFFQSIEQHLLTGAMD